MIIISSSAKTLDLKSSVPQGKVPHFIDEANKIQSQLGSMDLASYSKVLGVSESLAILNIKRMQTWSTQKARPSLFMYKGDVYRQLNAADYSEEQLDYAGKSVFAMSGLYGAVGALDEIKPYRLEMKAKLEGYGAMNAYWKPRVTTYFNELAEKEGHQCLLNLASIEYAKAMDRSELTIPVIDVEFKEEREGKLKIIGIMAKRARGMMIDYCIEKQIEDPAELRHFNAGGYEFIGESNGTLTFAR
ncbi:MAG: cytoplasmic iron level regulating protein YaaA (DUF328/UPF0246 family) [Oceanicoccus sp.]|jgi:cytoplasmic iron level regulating protein YaaA (DUF328/UPF0246 family)